MSSNGHLQTQIPREHRATAVREPTRTVFNRRRHSIDRIDNDRGYFPDNCRWATKAEQAFNRRSTVTVEHNGTAMALTAYAREMGICDKALWYRVRSLGEPLEVAVAKIRSGPVRKITEKQIREIKRSSESQTALGKRYGITQSAVWSILNGRSWRHVQ